MPYTTALQQKLICYSNVLLLKCVTPNTGYYPVIVVTKISTIVFTWVTGL